MMPLDSTCNYRTIKLYLTQHQQVCKEIWDFQVACTGDVTQCLSLASTLCVLIQILICKVFWVGFHICNKISNKFHEGS
jgi:hypothetical protein